MEVNLGNYTVKSLSDKIETEGGIVDFFLFYSSPESWVGTDIEDEVEKLVEAYDALVEKLEQLGVELE